MVKLQIDATGIIETAKTIASMPGALKQAQKYAGSKALTAIRSVAVTETAKEYYVKAKKVRAGIQIKRKTEQMQMIVRGRKLQIHNYLLTPKAPTKRKKYYLYGAIKRSGGVRKLGNDTFLMRTQYGKFIAMRRQGRRPLPIESIEAPAIPQIIGEDNTVLTAMTQAGTEAFTKEFKRQALRSIGVMP